MCVAEEPASRLKLPTLFFVECMTSLEILLLADELGASETLLLAVAASDDENAVINGTIILLNNLSMRANNCYNWGFFRSRNFLEYPAAFLLIPKSISPPVPSL